MNIPHRNGSTSLNGCNDPTCGLMPDCAGNRGRLPPVNHSDFWKATAERAAMREHIPEERRAGSGVRRALAADVPPKKIKIKLDDPHTWAVYETAQRAANEVASWPAWKRGEESPKPAKIEDTVKWSLDDERTLAFVREVWTALGEAGWHCALTGSVLHTGESKKDLDLVVYPSQKRKRPASKAAMRRALESIGMTQRYSRARVLADWKKRGIKDQKWVEVWQTSWGRRVDIMVMS